MDEKEQKTGNPQTQRDYGLQGEILIAVRQMIEQNKKETREEISSAFGTLRSEIANTYEVSKLDKIGQYLHLLYEAQKVTHNVHEEIDAALKQFKAEAWI
jgi:hypothetical protein